MKEKKFAAEAYDFMESVIGAVILVSFILVFFFRVAVVNGDSMIPTLHNGEKLILSTSTSTFDTGDIVVIHRDDAVALVKRVIATGGDTIDIDFDEGIVYVNGEALDEPYTAEPTYLHFEDGPEFPLTVPEGYLFCMGDNRNNSLDSRAPQVGLIREDYIVGKMVLDINNTEAK